RRESSAAADQQPDDEERYLKDEAYQDHVEKGEQGNAEDAPPAAPNELPGSPQRRDRASSLEYDGRRCQTEPDPDPDRQAQGRNGAEDGHDDGGCAALRCRQGRGGGPKKRNPHGDQS